jgi:hypothetical protein
MDEKMTWKHHVRVKIEQIRIKRREIYWLTNRNSKISMSSELLIYKTIIKLIWAYEIVLWGTTAKRWKRYSSSF